MGHLRRLTLALAAVVTAACGTPPAIAGPHDRVTPLQLTFDNVKVELLGTGTVTLDGKRFLIWTGREFTDLDGHTLIKVDADGNVWGRGLTKHPRFTADDRLVSADGEQAMVVARNGTVTLWTHGKPVPGPLQLTHLTPASRRLGAMLVLATLFERALIHAHDSATTIPGVEKPPAPDPIEAVDDTHFTIDGTYLAQLIADPDELANGARLVPTVKDGKPHGLELHGVRAGSVYARLGLVNGDILLEINGFELGGGDRLDALRTKLRDAGSFQIDLVRRGAPRSIMVSAR